jgi:hypothetical protein
MLFPPSEPRWFVVGVNYPSIAESGWTGNSLGPISINLSQKVTSGSFQKR